MLPMVEYMACAAFVAGASAADVRTWREAREGTWTSTAPPLCHSVIVTSEPSVSRTGAEVQANTRGLAEPGGPGDRGDRGADEGRLHDVVAPAHVRGAILGAYPHPHRGDHDAVGAEPANVVVQRAPGLVAAAADKFGPAAHFHVARPPAGLPGGREIVVPGPDGDAERQPGWHPARRHELGEVLAGQSGSKRGRRRV